MPMLVWTSETTCFLMISRTRLHDFRLLPPHQTVNGEVLRRPHELNHVSSSESGLDSVHVSLCVMVPYLEMATAGDPIKVDR